MTHINGVLSIALVLFLLLCFPRYNFRIFIKYKFVTAFVLGNYLVFFTVYYYFPSWTDILMNDKYSLLQYSIVDLHSSFERFLITWETLFIYLLIKKEFRENFGRIFFFLLPIIITLSFWNYEVFLGFFFINYPLYIMLSFFYSQNKEKINFLFKKL